MYKMIVCDLDETLLDNHAQISKANEQAIKRFVAQGGYFVPNTGRSFLTVQANLKQLGLFDKKDQYVISYNGGAIIENAANQVLTTNPLDFATVKKIYDIAQAEHVSGHIYTLKNLYVWQPSRSEQDYLAQRNIHYQPVTDVQLTFLKDQPLMKIILQDDDPARRRELGGLIPPQIKAPLTTTYSSSRYVEFNHVNADKGKATQQLAKKLGIKPAEVIALGDNSNDLAMLRAAGLGISVQNGTPEVKAAVDYVTEADNAHSAVAEAIKKFALQ